MASKYVLIELSHLFTKNPYDIKNCINLLEAQLDVNKPEEAIQTLEKMIIYHHLEEKLLQQSLTKLLEQSQQDETLRKKVLKLFEQSLEEGYYISIAKQYSKLLFQSTNTKMLTKNYLMSQFEKLLTQFSYDYYEGAKIFKRYRKTLNFYIANLEQQLQSDPSNEKLKRENTQIEGSIRALFKRQINIPHKELDLTWDAYNQWETSKDEIMKLVQMQQKTFEKTVKGEEFEKMFREVSFSKKNKAILLKKVLSKYEKGEQSNLEPVELLQGVLQQTDIERSKVLNFFEMAQHYSIYFDQNQVLQMWNTFQKFLIEQTNDQIRLKYYKRASRILPPDQSLAQLILRAIESLNRDDLELQKEYERLFGYLEGDLKSQIILQRSSIFFHCRKLMNQSDRLTEKEKNIYIEKIRSSFKENISIIQKLPQEEKQEQECNTYQKWAKIEAFLLADNQKAKEVMEQCVKKNSNQANIWETFIEIQNVTQLKNAQERDKLRGIYKRASEFVKDHCEAIYLKNIEFETLFGTIEELQKAEGKLINFYSQQQQQIEEQIGSDSQDLIDEEEEEEQIYFDKNKQKKGKNISRVKSDEVHEGENPKKKVKLNQEIHQEDVQEQPKIFIDSDQTIFVKNIPLDLTEDELIEKLPNIKAVKECRFVTTKDKKFKGFAYIDFDSSSSALQAVKTLNQLKIGTQELYAAVSKPPKIVKDDTLTIFLNNLPFTVTEDMIQNKLNLDKSIEYSEIRIIKDKNEKPKGYAYVELKDAESLEKALDVFINKPLIDGRKVFAERADSLGVIKRKQKTQVVLVKNLSFKAREKDIQELFEGMQLTQIVIPREINGKPRGFAFVEFQYLNDFQKALQINNAKILGRDVQIIKSDREITLHQEKHNNENGDIITQQEKRDNQMQNKPKSNADFKKFL